MRVSTLLASAWGKGRKRYRPARLPSSKSLMGELHACALSEDRIREEHSRREYEVKGRIRRECAVCYGGDAAEYPCPTIQALERQPTA